MTEDSSNWTIEIKRNGETYASGSASSIQSATRRARQQLAGAHNIYKRAEKLKGRHVSDMEPESEKFRFIARGIEQKGSASTFLDSLKQTDD